MANKIDVEIGATENVSSAIGSVADSAVRASRVVVSSSENMGQALDNAARESGTLNGAFGKLGGGVGSLYDGFGALGDSISSVIDFQNQGAQRASEQARKLLDVSQAMQDTEQAAGDLKQAQLDLNQAQVDSKQAALDAEQAQADAAQALIDARQAQEDYNAAVKENGPNSIEAAQAAQDLKQAQIDLKQANIDVEQATADQAQAQEDAAQAGRDLSQASLDAAGSTQDLIDAQNAAKPPGEVQQWANTLGTVTPIIMGVVAATDLLTLSTNVLTASWIKNAAASVASRIATIAGTVATAAYTAVQWLLNIALTANPIGIIIVAIGALIAVIIYLATKTQFFQTIWEYIWGFMKAVGAWFAGPFADFFIGAWNKITGAFQAAWNWIKNSFISANTWVREKIEAFINILRGINGALKEAFAKVTDIITAPFRAAFNFIARAWNNTVGRLHFSVPDWVPGIGGNGFSVPKIPTFATGAAQIMRTGAALVHKGERIVPAAAGPSGGAGMGGSMTLVIEPKSGVSRDLMDLIVENLNFRVRTGLGTEFD